MTEPKDMTCEHCRELLTDLVCGELNVRDEERARAHAAGCEECTKALKAFQFTIWAASEVPLEEPSPSLEARIMAAAEAALKKQPAVRAPPAGAKSFGAWLSKLGDWAMSPQVAMASVLVLVVGIGLYALPLGAPAPRAALAPPVEQDKSELPPSELGTGSAVPVEPVAPDKAKKGASAGRAARARAPRTGASSSAPKPEAVPREKFAPPPPAGSVADKASSAAGGLGSIGSGVGGGGRAGSDADDELARRDQAPESPARAGAVAERKTAEPFPQAEGTNAPAAAAPAQPATAPAPSAVRAETEAKDDAKREERVSAANDAPAPVKEPAPADGAESPAAQAPAADASVAPAAPKPPSERSELARGMQALSAGRLPQAISILNPLARAGSDEVRDLAQALLAEALHDSNRCKEAIQWFARITARPTASARSLELAADCYAKTGNDAKAAELRTRARLR